MTISGSPMRLMVLLAQGTRVEEVTRGMLSMLFTSTGTPPIHHCTEGVGIPWKEQLHRTVFSKEQEESNNLGGAVRRKNRGSSRCPDFASLLPLRPAFSLLAIHRELQKDFLAIQSGAGTQNSPLSSSLHICLRLGFSSYL